MIWKPERLNSEERGRWEGTELDTSRETVTHSEFVTTQTLGVQHVHSEEKKRKRKKKKERPAARGGGG